MEVSKPKWVSSNVIQYGVNSLRPPYFNIVMFFEVYKRNEQYYKWNDIYCTEKWSNLYQIPLTTWVTKGWYIVYLQLF